MNVRLNRDCSRLANAGLPILDALTEIKVRPNPISRLTLAALCGALLVAAGTPALAMPAALTGQWAAPIEELAPTMVQAQPVPGGPVAAPRPAVRPGYGRPAYGRPGYARPGYARPGYGRPGYRAWVRPYRWAPGGAIAAGFAIGFLTAGAVAAWAPPPPEPGMCWYYTDPSQQNGFWDYCQ
jgi:hypothetical protein